MSYQAIDIRNMAGVQVVEIPANVKIDDDKVYLKKVGDVLYLIPFHRPWQSMIDSVSEFSEDYMVSRNQPDTQDRESM